MNYRWRQLVFWFTVVPVLCLIVGCVSIGKDFQEDTVRAIQQGKTTKNNVLNMFGAPYSKGIENGEETWTYTYFQGRLIGWQSWTKDLTVRFDNNGVVNSYSYSNSWPPTR